VRRTRAVAGAIVAGGAIYGGLVRPWHLRWGATDADLMRPMPGDGLVTRPQLNATRAIVIDAPPEAVWPWIVQMGGYGRAGWYSYDWLDNGGRPSANQIVPQLQRLHPGDVMATGPDGTGFVVQSIQPPRSLVLLIDHPDARTSCSILLLREHGGRTRLVFRLRLRAAPNWRGSAFLAAMDAGDFFMMRKQLRGIRERAERHARGQGAPLSPRRVRFDDSVVVNCLPATAFALLTNVERYAVHPGSPVLAMDKLPPGETRTGTRWREVIRLVPFGEMTVWSEVTGMDRNRQLSERFWGPAMSGTLVYTLASTSDGRTVLRHQQSFDPAPAPLRRAQAWALERWWMPRAGDRLRAIRDLLETPPVVLPDAAPIAEVDR
jgi:hypothetical protein